MRTLQVGDRPTQLALALAEFGRIEKTLHALNYIDDENRRRATLLQLNRGEGRHSLASNVFYGSVVSYVNATGKGRRISWVP
jgi:TnpA family transposase